MSGRLDGRCALVTGAGSGIGRAVAQRFVDEGARVVFADRDLRAAQEAAAGSAAPDLTRATEVDISDEDAVAACFSSTVGAGWSLDVVVAHAGVQLFGEDARVDDLALDAWRRTLEVNLTGTFLTIKHAVRAMRPQGAGSIVVTGSPTGLRGSGRGFTAYSASKAGVHGLVRIAAADCADDGVRVNCVVPGFTRTPLVRTLLDDESATARRLDRIPLGRAATPRDLEGMYVFLASEEAQYCTGATFTVDGGMTSA